MANIVGTTGNDTLVGTIDNDTINALTGFDRIDGGAGWDSLTVDYSVFNRFSGRWVSTVTAASGSLSGLIESRVSNDFVEFSSIENLNVKLGRAQDYFIFIADGPLASRSLTVDAGAGTDLLAFLAGAASNITFLVAPDGLVSTSLGGTFLGFESYSVSASAGNHVIQTGAFDDSVRIIGGSGSIRTGAGNDVVLLENAAATIDAGEGQSDYLNLDLGSATYTCTAVFDGSTGLGSAGAKTGRRTTFVGIDILDLAFGSGNDSVKLSNVANAHVSTGAGADIFTLVGINTATLDGGSGIDRLSVDMSGLESSAYTQLRSNGMGGFTGSIGFPSGLGISNIERIELKLSNAGNILDVDAAALVLGARLSAVGGSGEDSLAIDFSSFAKVSAQMGTDGVFRAAGATFAGFEYFNLIGSAGSDNLVGGALGNVIDGGSGNDVIRGGAGDDILLGGDGNDKLYGLGGANDLYGGAGDDSYYCDSTDGYSLITEYNGEGTDTIYSSVSNIVYTNVEKLVLTGTADIAGSGSSENDTIIGNPGSNRLDGGDGNDTISGGDGNDSIGGNSGADTLIGGKGRDIFFFDALESSAERDIVKDFLKGEDSIVLIRDTFTAYSEEAFGSLLPSNSFRVGRIATTLDEHIIYDQKTGSLYYDSDGSGGDLQIMIANFNNKPVLTASDFQLL